MAEIDTVCTYVYFVAHISGLNLTHATVAHRIVFAFERSGAYQISKACLKGRLHVQACEMCVFNP